jgi:hypothetical protein
LSLFAPPTPAHPSPPPPVHRLPLHPSCHPPPPQVEILRTESLGKDRSTAEEVRLNHGAQHTREALRTELARCNRAVNELKAKSDQQLMEVWGGGLGVCVWVGRECEGR